MNNGIYYRYGFNGKENDDEVKGQGNQQDYGMRIYDPRLGRFLSVDPLAQKYPWYTPYQFTGNNPIQNIDLDGGEPKDAQENWIYKQTVDVRTGKKEWDAFTYHRPKISWTTYNAVYDNVTKQYWFINQGNDGQYYYWKHNPGADQSRYMAGAGKANGVWEKFTPYTKPNPANALTAITVTPLVTLPALLSEAAPAFNYLLKFIEEKAKEQVPEQKGYDERGSELIESYNKTQDPTIDCSEFAEKIYNEVPRGNIYELTPKSGRWMNGVEYGEVQEFTYHQFYKKDDFVYDPMFGSKPVKFEEFIKKYNDLNPEGFKMEIKK